VTSRKANPAFSRLRPSLIALVCASLVATAAILGQWVINVYFGFRRVHGIGLVGPTISFVVTGVLVSIIEFRAEQRRKARLARAQVVADCNHEIRNALQSMVGLSYAQESVDQIRDAVNRIDWALRDLLPRVQDDDGKPPQWEIHQGRLTIKDHLPISAKKETRSRSMMSGRSD
jgi:hypothetical protein